MKIKMVLFDFDGTLADSFGWFTSAFALAARKYGFRELTNAELEKLRGKGSREIMRELRIPWWKVPFIARFMRQHMHAQKPDISLFHGIEEVIHELKNRGIIVAIVTSNSESNVRSILKDKLSAKIDIFECDVSLFGKKSRFKKLLRKYSFDPSEVLSIGDEIRDLEAAKIAGLKSGVVTWGYALPESLKARHPDYIFSRAQDIISFCFE